MIILKTILQDKEQGKKDELKESIPELDNSTKFATKQLQLNENLASFSKEQLVCIEDFFIELMVLLKFRLLIQNA